MPIFTIDPPTAKDLDDALSLRRFRALEDVDRFWGAALAGASAPTDGGSFDDLLAEHFNDGQAPSSQHDEDDPFRYSLVGVHIADVAHYVRPGDLVDTEARSRCTTVYLPDNVYHMLPPKLSETWCSLTAGADKLAFSVFFVLNDSTGELVPEQTRFLRTKIRSGRRLAYGDVDGALGGDGQLNSAPYIGSNIITSNNGLTER